MHLAAVKVDNVPDPDAMLSLGQALKLPGVKHMFDNITNYVLSKLEWYPVFAATCFHEAVDINVIQTLLLWDLVLYDGSLRGIASADRKTASRKRVPPAPC